MEVFIGNVPPTYQDPDLRNYFRPVLEALSILVFDCHKINKKNAILTFRSVWEGQIFLTNYGEGTYRLQITTYPLYCRRSNKEPDEFLLRSLAMKAKQQQREKHNSKESSVQTSDNSIMHSFNISTFYCGVWAYKGSEVVFSPQYTSHCFGELKFAKRSLWVLLQSGHRIDIAYDNVQALAIDDSSQQSLTISCHYTPRFSDTDMAALLKYRLIISDQKTNKETRMRLSSLETEHEGIASSCLVYRFELVPSTIIRQLRGLKFSPEIPLALYTRTQVHSPCESWKVESQRAATVLASTFSGQWFPISFQMQRLLQNGYLSPPSVTSLIPEMKAMSDRSGIEIAAGALRKLSFQIPFRGPEIAVQEFSTQNLVEQLRDNEQQAMNEDHNPSSSLTAAQSPNRANIYRAKVTPAGYLLSGPFPETMNRVLRKYSKYLDYFLRVEFCDEDGQQIRYDPQVSNNQIFYGRFKKVLQDGISISGRVYGFLGYSHSSLRAQTCWFMAPFYHEEDKELKLYQNLIAELGDFSQIYCPAKCAARIGQTFSDTPTTVSLGLAEVKTMPDVERNDRIFSDGVGTCSESVLDQIWDAQTSNRKDKPRVIQIRHDGAKGMLSLDSRIKEHAIFLRPSMIKFPSPKTMSIEICGGAWNPLPMFLNRQLIKIMEDLGVSEQFFFDLQTKAVEDLRTSTMTDINAANFLAAHNVGNDIRLQWFIRDLMSLNLSFKDDYFLRNIVKTAAMVELRALKHRTRLPVEEGYTLYGVMDETGILEEGQVFVTINTSSGQQKQLVGTNIIVTRSPALHPGDVRLVDAVDVPEDSPLMKLSNCICFSQKGARDLPSQLSGGDLDGDLYNIIFDHRASLGRPVHAPADYPRPKAIDIGRPVERNDMTDFLVAFMATDPLGRIAILHMALADQSEDGTLDERCLKLAELHSTAVDYSKTGIPVQLTGLPKHNRYRPDFMAPGPHVIIIEKEDIDFGKDAEIGNQDEEDIQIHTYYESHKILGKLYRAIDEREVFRDIQQMGQSRGVHNDDRSLFSHDPNVMGNVLAYVRQCCHSLRWEHFLEQARDIRQEYEDLLLQIMCDYSQQPLRPISETEVFVGNILGKTGAQSKKQRENSTTMRERFSDDVTYIMNKIVRDGANRSTEARERAVACFEVAFETRNAAARKQELDSFKYVAASVCLREINRDSGETRLNGI